MRAQDRAAVRILMARRDQTHAVEAAARNSPRPEPASESSEPTAATPISEPKVAAAAAGGTAAAEVSAAAATAAAAVVAAGGGTTVNITVKFGKRQLAVALVLEAGVAVLQQQLFALTKVPAAAQTIVGAGGRKWWAGGR